MTRILLMTLALSLAACDGTAVDMGTPMADGGMADPVDPVNPVEPMDPMDPVDPMDPGVGAITYHAHVRPLLAQYCESCHASGQLGPFPLTTFEEARPWAAPMASSVRERRMPPFLADADGDCQAFHNSSWLTAEQIAIFEAWAEDPQEGDPSIPAPPSRELPRISGETVSVDTGVDYLPDQTKTDDYRCFVVDSPGDISATGFSVRPSNPRIAHHLIAYQAIDEDAAAEARALDAADDGPGYTCLGTGPRVDARNIAGWAPGAGDTLYPAGTGVNIRGDLPLIIEMHYNTVGGMGETDRTALVFETTVPGSVIPLYEVGVLDYDFEGPPGEARWSTTDGWPMQWALWDEVENYEGRVRIHGVNGHMHERGVSLRMEVTGSANACLVDMPRWDWNWQQSYWFEDPIDVDAQDFLSITCVFDTRDMDTPLVWGDGTGDEMCLGGLYVTLLD